MKIKERWLPVKGYEGKYEVSDLGNVRSLNYKGTGKVKLLKQWIRCDGYLDVMLCKNGKMKHFFVHRLVVTAFIGPIEKGLQVNHKNEIKTDNRLSNLEVVTPRENINFGTRTERAVKAKSKQLDLIEVEYPHREYTFQNSYIASEFFGYQSESQVGILIFNARKRGENFINIRKKRYFFAQEA